MGAASHPPSTAPGSPSAVRTTSRSRTTAAPARRSRTSSITHRLPHQLHLHRIEPHHLVLAVGHLGHGDGDLDRGGQIDVAVRLLAGADGLEEITLVGADVLTVA